jgi:hypothetical protein
MPELLESQALSISAPSKGQQLVRTAWRALIRRIPFYYLGALLFGVPLTLQFAYSTLAYVDIPASPYVPWAAVAGNLLAAKLLRKKLADSNLRTGLWSYLGYGAITMATTTSLSYGIMGLTFGTIEVLAKWWWLIIPSSLTMGMILTQFDAFDRRMKKLA